jgi:hypothetical protein
MSFFLTIICLLFFIWNIAQNTL